MVYAGLDARLEQMLEESKRRGALNRKRREVPCRFADGISSEEFEELASDVAGQIKRIKEISIDGAVIYCTVVSQTGHSTWDFQVDFNNWGHITGTRWTRTDNEQSNIPTLYGGLMSTAIHRLLEQRNIQLGDLSDAVDANSDLDRAGETNENNSKRFTRFLFSKTSFLRRFEPQIELRYAQQELIGEHLYPVISLLKENGFCNIITVPVKDVGRGSNAYVYQVAGVTIGKNILFEQGKSYGKYSKVVVTYHDKLEIKMPYEEKHFRRRNYIEVIEELWGFGFAEIRKRPCCDLITGWIKKDGSVENVLTASDKPIQKDEVYNFDDKITVVYHQYKTTGR